MKKSKKIVIFSSLGAVLAGLIIVAAILGSVQFDFGKLSSEHFRTHDAYPVDEPFEKVEVETINGDIVIRQSSGKYCKVTCSISEHVTYDVKSENGTLKIKQNDSRQWYEHLGVIWEPPYGVVVELPAKTYEKLSIKTTSGKVWVHNRDFRRADISSISGNIQLLGCSAGRVKTATTSGDIQLLNTNTTSLELVTTSGEIWLSDTNSTGTAAISSVSGDVLLYAFDAPNMKVSTISGDVDATLLSGKNFLVQSRSGDVDVPLSDPSGGTCEITTTSGDIGVSVHQQAQ